MLVLVLAWAWMPLPISATAVAACWLCRRGARVCKASVVYLHG